MEALPVGLPHSYLHHFITIIIIIIIAVVTARGWRLKRDGGGWRVGRAWLTRPGEQEGMFVCLLVA